MTRKPQWLRQQPVRKRSDKLVKKAAKRLPGGRTTVNSGATFGQNDITSDSFDIEHKFTDKESYSVKLSELGKLQRRTKVGKTPVFMIEFIKGNNSKKYVVVEYDDFFT